MRNRSSISAFIQNTKAIGRIMISALHNADLDISRNVNIFRCIDVDRESSFILQMVATLAVFRTVESLPTLVKTWFNDDFSKLCEMVSSTSPLRVWVTVNV